MIEGQEGLDWGSWHHLCETVDALGFDSLWRSDHLLPMRGESDDSIECWTSLAVAAVWTKRITIGPNVSPMTFREPGLLAKMAASVDGLSRGRLVLGIGAGWFEREHREFEIPFPTLRERMDRMDEAIDVIEQSLARDGARRIPILIGGEGERRTLRSVARYASLWSTPDLLPLDEYRHKTVVLDRHCQQVGRDPSEIRRAVQTPFLIGRNEAELLERADGLRRASWFRDKSPAELVTALRQRNFAGTPDEIAEKMRSYQELGVDLWMLVHFWPDDESLRLVMSELAPLVA